jgi:hypothetical protein
MKSWWNSQSSCRQSSGWSLLTLSCTHCKTSHWLSGLPGWFICNNPLDVKENYEHAPDFAIRLSRTFRSALNLECYSSTRERLVFSSPNACLIIARVSVERFLRFAHNLIHSLFLCRIHGEIALGQIHDSKQKDVKNQNVHPSAWNFAHWIPRYASIVIYRCIALLQLLYRWQHQFQKLRIPPRMLHKYQCFRETWTRLLSSEAGGSMFLPKMN